jgi:hypothetical protein
MIRDFLFSVFSFLVIEPFQAELQQSLAAARAPQALVQDVGACARAAAPVLADRALNDWWWAGTTAISVGIGMRTPESVVTEAAPSCAPTMQAVRPFLNAARA